jgi:hypothetical protein
MARPWKKNWPYVGRRAKSWIIGFYDHEGVERSRSFPSAALARDWMREYSACERRGPDSLCRFLLDLDAAEANAAEGRTIGEIIELYFECDADPQLRFLRTDIDHDCRLVSDQTSGYKARDSDQHEKGHTECYEATTGFMPMQYTYANCDDPRHTKTLGEAQNGNTAPENGDHY